MESFARAANELGTTAAAVSQQIRTLEEWLGQRLFERKPRGVILTATGKTFGAEVSSALEKIAIAAESIRKRAPDKQVSISSLPSVVNHWLGERLPDFQRRHPDIQVSITYSAGATTAEEAGTDLLLCHGPQPSLSARLMLSGATRPAASPAYISEHGPFAEPRDLLSAQLLHDQSQQSWIRWFRAAGVEAAPQKGPIFADFNLLRSSLLAGLGIGLCPIALISKDVEEGRLILLFEQASDQAQGYWLLQRKQPSPEAGLMRDWLLEQALEHFRQTRDHSDGAIL
ncbi:LysR substrate-binding domain-containing protein [Rhizobium oryzicola]|uniref:LysR substrate-binding domain-containing protein n=1 Tax=Rhizobium oryzicola TaxID=1232668 RepID=A0ABT8T0A4_9HYPH|nr:LysR substrate-binding domain-containing protein [Rhizobium oryzicola]MDO1583940.1 LysR substrate-binding domain-containing protein [Rhizobium oryzicola]